MVDKSEKFHWLVRLGFAARGLVYILIGFLALTASRPTGPEGAFDLLQEAPLGAPLLYLAALGLAAYALFRLASLVFDVENHGSSGKGLMHRAGHGASAVAHIALAWTAFQFAHGDKQAASGSGAQEAAGTLLSFPLGSLMLGVVGIGFIGAAVLQARSALSASFNKKVSANAPAILKTLGRIGHAARAVVFLIIGWSLARSAWFGTTGEVKSLGEAVGSLADSGALYTVVAAGLLVFGVFSLLLARYRIIPDIERADLRPSLH